MLLAIAPKLSAKGSFSINKFRIITLQYSLEEYTPQEPPDPAMAIAFDPPQPPPPAIARAIAFRRIRSKTGSVSTGVDQKDDPSKACEATCVASSTLKLVRTSWSSSLLYLTMSTTR